jgi:hypothetical protein
MNPHAAGLSWTIKKAFLGYIARMDDGRCSVTDGATVLSEERGLPTFGFELAGHETPSPGTTRLCFRGDVRFAGHHGMLFVRVVDPVVDVSGSRARLSVLDEGSCRELVEFEVVPFDSPEGGGWHGTGVRLTAEGSDLFGGAYPDGEAFDDLVVALPADLPCLVPDLTSPTRSAT